MGGRELRSCASDARIAREWGLTVSKPDTLGAVIDGSHSVRREVAGVIRSAGFAVEVFSSAEEFIRFDQMPCTACLVVNVEQKGMGGLQLQSHLAAAGRHIPIILIATSADESARALARQLGALNVSDNPSGEEALLREICLTLKPRDKEGQTSFPCPGS
jgi:FixJ family two-component response regulator